MTTTRANAEDRIRKLAANMSDEAIIRTMIEADAACRNHQNPETTLVRVWAVKMAEQKWPEATNLVHARFDEEDAEFEHTHQSRHIDYVGTLVGSLRALDIIGDGDLPT